MFVTSSVDTELEMVLLFSGVGDVCREHGISDATYYRWKAQYGGLEVSELRRLRHLEDENRKLKQIVADLTLDNRALKDLATKNW